jgi:diacylglycerol kinase (ATP)
MQNPRIILNPVAGRGRGALSKGEIEKIFRQQGQSYDLLMTNRPGDATQWACDAAQEGVPYVVSAGGDGTANEVMSGLSRWVQSGGDADRLPKFGLIALGTGNDFGYNFGISPNIASACQRIFAGKPHLMDIGLVECDTESPSYFVNGVGLGFDAVVNIESRKIRFVRGAAVYLPAVLQTILFYYRAPHVVVEYDGERFEDNLMMISVMNGERFGAVFHMTPGCKIDDRLLSLCFARRMSRPKMLSMIPRFVRGTHITDPKVRLATAGKITLESDEPLPAHVDGEIYTVRARRYQFSITPWQVSIIC